MAIVDVDGSSLSGLEKKLSLKKGFQVFRFLKVFLGFLYKDQTSTTQKHMKNIPCSVRRILLKTNLQ